MIVKVDNALSFLNRFMYRLSAVVVCVMPVPIFVDVVLRFFTGKSIRGVIEIEEFLLCVLVYASVAYMQSHKEHITIDIITRRLPERLQQILVLFVYSVSFVLFALMSWRVGAYALEVTNEVSFQLRIPVSIFVGFSSAGIGMLALTLLLDTLRAFASLRRLGGSRWTLLASAAAIVFMALPWMAGESVYHWEGLYTGGLGMGVLFALIFLGMPIAFAMFLVGFEGLWVLNANLDGALAMLGAVPYGEVSTWIMVVAPLFILMGELAYFSGLSEDLFAAAYKWFGRMPGGLAISSVAGCAGFAAVCGDSLATSVTMGSIALPEMKKKGYDASLATGSIAAGGTLGILIPPSVGFIFYALVTEASIGRLFIAGVIPGILLTALFIITIYVMARLKPDSAPPGDPTSLGEKIVALKGVLAMIGLLVLILGGILGGVFSPTEGGAVGAVGAFAYALARRKITWKVMALAATETTKITTKLLLIVAGVGLLGAFLASTRLPFALADMFINLGMNRYLILGAIIFFYIVLGCALNVIAVILITLPAIFPTITALGFDPIWFGVISVILMEMGQITPPIGIIVFAVSSVADGVPMEIVFKGIAPFVLCMIVCVLLLILFPQLALFLPGLFFGS